MTAGWTEAVWNTKFDQHFHTWSTLGIEPQTFWFWHPTPAPTRILPSVWDNILANHETVIEIMARRLLEIRRQSWWIFLVQVQLAEVLCTPSLFDRGLNSWPPDHEIIVYVIKMPALTIWPSVTSTHSDGPCFISNLNFLFFSFNMDLFAWMDIWCYSVWYTIIAWSEHKSSGKGSRACNQTLINLFKSIRYLVWNFKEVPYSINWLWSFNANILHIKDITNRSINMVTFHWRNKSICMWLV